jgi:AcrR family transcriptional regulator
MSKDAPKPEGLRERKRRETLQRIAAVGLQLFLAKGYEAATLDEIAAAAGISRRTFFYYFKSKDDILLAYLDGYGDALKASVRESSPAGVPLDVARDAVLKVATRAETSETIATARLMRNVKALRARGQVGYLHREQALYEALCELWPAKERREGLRFVAMASMGAARLAVDTWLAQDGKRPLAKCIQDAFKTLKAEI